MKILCCFSVLIFAFIGNLYSTQDKWGNNRPSVWRSSYSESADLNVIVSTASDIILWDVVVGSPSPNSSITIYDSTGSWLTNVSTVAKIATDTRTQGNPYGIYLSSGLVYNKIGTAQIIILWDFIYNFNR